MTDPGKSLVARISGPGSGRAILIVLLGAAASRPALAEDTSDAAGEKVRGTLVSRTATSLSVRPEGEQEIRRYVIPPESAMDAKTALFFRELAVGSLVRVTFAHARGSRSIDVFLLAAPGKFGLLAGTVTDKAPVAAPGKPAEWIELTDEAGQAARYTPPWTGKSFDAEMLQAFSQRLIGDRVEIRWTADDHRRLTTMRVLGMSDQTAEGDGGTARGRVLEKGKDWLTIQTDSGDKQRYVPQRIVGRSGERDKTVIRAIAGIKVGSRVEGLWFDDGERQLYSLKPAADAHAKEKKSGFQSAR